MKNSKNKIVLWGGGGHGHVVIDTLRAAGGWEIVGIIDNTHPLGTEIMGTSVLGDTDMLPALREQGVAALVVAVGSGAARQKMIQQAEELGFSLPAIIHPSAEVFPSASIGPGCVVCSGATIGAQVRLGSGVIVNTHAIVDHDCVIGDYSHISPAAVLCGVIQIGERTWVGAGSVLRDHLTIGDDVMIGMGSVVVSDVPAEQAVCGNPAKEMR